MCAFAIDKMGRLVYSGTTWDRGDIVNLHKANLSCILINDNIHKLYFLCYLRRDF
jgi:hypothetical protein